MAEVFRWENGSEMLFEADIGAVGQLIGEPSRAGILLALMDADGSLSVTDLAARADVSLPTASEHLGKLERGGLVRSERRGRNRVFSLAGSDVAHAIEALATIAPPIAVRSLRQSSVAATLAEARTCYDHLAGRLGVALLDDLLGKGAVRPAGEAFEITARGGRLLGELDIDVARLRTRRRPLARPCLDWTERRPHLAGATGAAICRAVRERNWMTKRGRVVRVTEAGRDGFARWLGPRSRVAASLK